MSFICSSNNDLIVIIVILACTFFWGSIFILAIVKNKKAISKLFSTLNGEMDESKPNNIDLDCRGKVLDPSIKRVLDMEYTAGKINTAEYQERINVLLKYELQQEKKKYRSFVLQKSNNGCAVWIIAVCLLTLTTSILLPQILVLIGFIISAK